MKRIKDSPTTIHVFVPPVVPEKTVVLRGKNVKLLLSKGMRNSMLITYVTIIVPSAYPTQLAADDRPLGVRWLRGESKFNVIVRQFSFSSTEFEALNLLSKVWDGDKINASEVHVINLKNGDPNIKDTPTD